MKGNYYEVLGVAVDASEEEVRRAYLRLALKWHPDKHRGEPAASQVFQRVSQAYEVLGDPSRRAEYDEATEWDVNAMCLEDYLALFQNFTLTLNGMGLEMRGSSAGRREWRPLEELQEEEGAGGLGAWSPGRRREGGSESSLLASPPPSSRQRGSNAFK